MTLSARPITDSDGPDWEGLAGRYGCVFDHGRWTGLFEGRVQRVGLFDRGGELRGGFSFWTERRLGFHVARNPPFTAYSGPFFEARATNPAARAGEHRAVMEAVASYLANIRAAVVSLGLAVGIVDCLPFYWSGFKVIPRYTYRIDLARDEREILRGFSPERRNDIRKAERDGISAEVASSTTELRSLVMESFSRNRKSLPVEWMDRILEEFSPGRGGLCVISRRSGEPVAGVYIVHDSRTAFYLMGGYTRGAHHGAGALALWRGLVESRAFGLGTFDFEGSVAPPIERYFRGFGGVLTPVLSVHRAWLPLEVVLKIRHRSLF